MTEKAIGGSHVCHTCEAHCVVIEDLEAELAEKKEFQAIQDRLRQRDSARIAALAAALREIENKCRWPDTHAPEIMNFDEIKARTDALRHWNPQGYQEFVVAMKRDREQLVDHIESLRGTDVCPHCDKNYPHQHFIDRKGYASDRGTDDSWLCVCGLTVKKRYHCMCGGREDNSRAERFANDAGAERG